MAFGNGGFEVRLARLARLLVAYEKDGQQFRVVVLVGRELGLLAFDESLFAIEVSVVAGRESLPTARARRVLARRASGEQQEQREAAQGPYGAKGFDSQSGVREVMGAKPWIFFLNSGRGFLLPLPVRKLLCLPG